MSAFKLDDRGIKAVQNLKTYEQFDIFVNQLKEHLSLLDSENRIINEPNKLLKQSGKAQLLSEVLDSVEKS